MVQVNNQRESLIMYHKNTKTTVATCTSVSVDDICVSDEAAVLGGMYANALL